MIANELIRYTGNGSPRNFEGVHAVYLMDEKRNKDTAPLIYLFFFFFFFFCKYRSGIGHLCESAFG